IDRGGGRRARRALLPAHARGGCGFHRACLRTDRGLALPAALLLSFVQARQILAALDRGDRAVEASFDLGRTTVRVDLAALPDRETLRRIAADEAVVY